MAHKAFVIDDSSLDRQLIAEHLKDLSVDCIPFDCGRQALGEIEKTAPQVCVVDIYMPEMDGLEVIRSLRRQGYEGLVIAVTGKPHHATFDVLKYAESFGADVVMKKPVNAERFAQAVTQELRAS